ncbi:hypothetical protein O181_059749 [Austropuccinia psidii MF-1]|uniref:Uncharacterized protein n=1 Tax=Austropuccinia psidii MF-1 TaxID=1389203 RepID=A0A9Q3EEV9_9BASI|nr:hypothetical protein [Austropuccinia psidii MF-1]
MSYSKPHKSYSGSVHDSDSESSIKYVQTKSPLSPKIPPSMNVSGLNIDVGNPMAQTPSTWSIQNTSVTPIPPNLTNTQVNVSEGPENTPEIPSKAIPNQNFHMTSSLILVGSQSRPRIPLDKVNSQPSIFHQDLRFVWGMKSRLMGGNEKTIGKCYLEWSVGGKSRTDASSK